MELVLLQMEMAPTQSMARQHLLPPWTVLFSIAGAVITDAGGILSHAGTVAREYKLPAVLGTKVGTQLLKDGDVVTVDGTSGVVYIGTK